jgi:hypothetical protein
VVDREERLAMYSRAEHILVEHAALVPLHYGRFHMLLKPWVTRYPSSSLAVPLWHEVILEPHQDRQSD